VTPLVVVAALVIAVVVLLGVGRRASRAPDKIGRAAPSPSPAQHEVPDARPTAFTYNVAPTQPLTPGPAPEPRSGAYRYDVRKPHPTAVCRVSGRLIAQCPCPEHGGRE
jgi:hypothetical protein